MADSDAMTDFQRSTRMPLDAVVRLHFEGTVAYQNGFAANVSASGMYVKHPEPPPVGTRLVFEFTIGAQRKPVQGAGEVVWSRAKYEGPGRPAGAGIRFVELDPLSRQHLTEALFEFLEASLGDRVIESPEARALVASMPTKAPPEALSPIEPEPEPAPAPVEELPPLPPMPPLRVEEAGAGSPTPFRIFDEEPGPFAEALPPVAAPPAIPPPESTPESPVTYGAAVARPEGGDRRPWLIATGIVAILALAFGAWWLFLRPSAPATAPAPAPAPPPAAAEPARPAPPPLEARVAEGKTLVESVGGAVKVPETPLPAPGPAPGGEPEPAEAASPAPATEPAPAPAPVETAAAPPSETAPSLPAVTGVREITAAGAAGTTVVTISGNGAFTTGGFSWSEIGGDKPRVLVKLKGIRESFRGAVRGAPTAELAGIRVGYHPEIGNGELHVVLDLPPGARVQVQSIEPAADRLLLTLKK